MRYLELATSKPISKIGLGTFQFGSPEWGYGESYATTDSRAIVRRGLELGMTLFDTAEIYGSGRSEHLLSDALGDERNRVFLATKIFPVVPSTLKRRARASMRRLRVARLDLYQVHWANPFVRDETLMRGLRELRLSELVSEIGVSGYDVDRWCSAEVALRSRIISNQVEYSLLHRHPEASILPFARASGRAVIAFSPLAQGLLSGRYHDGNSPSNFRATHPRFGFEHLRRIRPLIEMLRDIGRAHSATPAQVALAWVIHHPCVAAIPGASSVEQVEMNAAASNISLTNWEYEALRAVARQVAPEPARPRSSGPDLVALRHAARGYKYVGKTAWHELEMYLTALRS